MNECLQTGNKGQNMSTITHIEGSSLRIKSYMSQMPGRERERERE